MRFKKKKKKKKKLTSMKCVLHFIYSTSVGVGGEATPMKLSFNGPNKHTLQKSIFMLSTSSTNGSTFQKEKKVH